MKPNVEIMPEQPGNCALSNYLLVIRNDHLIINEATGDGGTVFHRASMKHYGLGGTGKRIWELLGQPIMIGEIVNVLLDEYEIDRLTCEAQVYAFLARLSEEKLLQFAMR